MGCGAGSAQIIRDWAGSDLLPLLRGAFVAWCEEPLDTALTFGEFFQSHEREHCPVAATGNGH